MGPKKDTGNEKIAHTTTTTTTTTIISEMDATLNARLQEMTADCEWSVPRGTQLEALVELLPGTGFNLAAASDSEERKGQLLREASLPAHSSGVGLELEVDRRSRCQKRSMDRRRSWAGKLQAS
jgi:hypothetical protein